MFSISVTLGAICAASVVAVAFPVDEPPRISRRAISESLLDDLIRYTNYSSATYQDICLSPLGNSFVFQFNDLDTNTQGFVTRDDNRKEIIVAYRGTLQLQDALTDADVLLQPFSTPGLSSSQANGVSTHQGFSNAFNSVASTVISQVTAQLQAHPSYTLVSTGHSMGGSLASIGAISLAANFPAKPLKLYTFGQPRTGNPAYASLVQTLVGVNNIFRAVHTSDGVPTIIPEVLGYQHHATEYWNFQDPPIASNVKECQGAEDPTCSDSIPSLGIDLQHITYFGQAMALEPSVCL